MRLMADGGLPLPAARPRPPRQRDHPAPPDRGGEQLELRVRAADLRPHPKGRAFSLLVDGARRRRARLGGARHDPSTRRRRPGGALGRGARGRPGGRPRRHRVEPRRRSRPPLRGRLRGPQPDPHAFAQRQGIRLPARDRPRDVEQGPLPRPARGQDPRRLQRRGALPEAAAAAGAGRLRARSSATVAGSASRCGASATAPSTSPASCGPFHSLHASGHRAPRG